MNICALPDDLIFLVLTNVIAECRRTSVTEFTAKRVEAWLTVQSLWVLAPKASRTSWLQLLCSRALGVHFSGGIAIFSADFSLWHKYLVDDTVRQNMHTALQTVQKTPRALQRVLFLWGLFPTIGLFPANISKFRHNARSMDMWVVRFMTHLLQELGDYAASLPIKAHLEFDGERAQSNSRTCSLIICPTHRVHSGHTLSVETHVGKTGQLSYRVSTNFTRVQKTALTFHAAVAVACTRLYDWKSQFTAPGW